MSGNVAFWTGIAVCYRPNPWTWDWDEVTESHLIQEDK